MQPLRYLVFLILALIGCAPPGNNNPGTDPPPNPSNFKATSTTSSINLSWDAVASASSYSLERSEDGTAFISVASGANTAFTDTNISGNNSYTYRLKALNANGASPGVDLLVVPGSSASVPDNPGNFVASNIGATSVTLGWSSASGATGYRLERRTAAGSYSTVATPSSTGYTDSGLLPNTLYNYRLKATNSSSESSGVSLELTTAAQSNNEVRVLYSVTGTSAQTIGLEAYSKPIHSMAYNDTDAAVLAAVNLANLLGHYDLKISLAPIDSYKAGDAAKSLRTFYVGTIYDELVPAAFKTDTAAGAPITWIGYNIWQLSTPQQQALGISFKRFITSSKSSYSSGFNTIAYRGYDFKKEVAPLELVGLSNTADVSVLATARNSAGTAYPYALQRGNFWYVADNPFSYTGRRDRYLIVADLLGPMIGRNETCSPKAAFRLEDINPNYGVSNFKNILDMLERIKVPFGVTVVPVYRNINTNTTINYSSRAALLEQVRRVETIGGRIFQHGYTHQYETLKNPQGVTGTDYEFWNINTAGPISGLTAQGAADRINLGKNILQGLGLNPVGWVSPHYAMEPSYYPAVNPLYPRFWEQRFYRVGQMAEPQFYPYPVVDYTGALIIPENLDYIRSGNSFSDMLETAKANLALHCPWANFFVHPDLTDPTYSGSDKFSVSHFEQFIGNMKALGYQFVDPISITR